MVLYPLNGTQMYMLFRTAISNNQTLAAYARTPLTKLTRAGPNVVPDLFPAFPFTRLL
jgi:hypothetical protein